MTNMHIQHLLSQIAALENELAIALQERETTIFFEIKGKRIKFEKSVKQAHKKLKTGLLRWLVTDRPQNLITAPIIYCMIIPLLIADGFISFYQAICFPVYGIEKVKRNEYIVIDRQHLEYLNFFQKFHCTYCAYGVGLIAYLAEIIARTEQYFCPIKHARKMLGTHARYITFLEYGDAIDYAKKLEQFRIALEPKK